MAILHARRVGALCSVTTWVLLVGCSSTSSSSSSSSTQTSNSDSGAGGGGGAADCSSRCTTLAGKCKTDPSQCTQFCAAASDAELTCVEQANCDGPKSQACLKSGGGGGGADSGSSDNSCSGISAGGALETGHKVTCQCKDGTNATGCYLPDSSNACGTACLDDSDCVPSQCTSG